MYACGIPLSPNASPPFFFFFFLVCLCCTVSSFFLLVFVLFVVSVAFNGLFCVFSCRFCCFSFVLKIRVGLLLLLFVSFFCMHFVVVCLFVYCHVQPQRKLSNVLSRMFHEVVINQSTSHYIFIATCQIKYTRTWNEAWR